MKSIKKQKIIITGATSGIGRQLTIKLAKEGASLAICGRTKERMNSLLDQIKISEKKLYHKTFCLSDEKKIISFVKNAEEKIGPVTVLINCAGINSARDPVRKLKTEDLDWMMTINFKAPFIFMRETARLFQKRKKGHIINILSTVCLQSKEDISAYTASKAALDALTKVFRKEARADNVKVTSVYPGGTNTTFRSWPREDYMSPESVANAIFKILTLDDDVVVHDFVFRPMVEMNFY